MTSVSQARSNSIALESRERSADLRPQPSKLVPEHIPSPMLARELQDYIRSADSGDVDLASCVTEAGLCCTRCGSGFCARPRSWRLRKRITDLSTGRVFEN